MRQGAFSGAVLVVALVIGVAMPAGASAAGCEVFDDPRERAECEVREQAREESRAAVAAASASPSVTSATGAGSTQRSPEWAAAIEEAQTPDLRDLIQPRPVAAMVGIVWLALLVRRWWRSMREQLRSRAGR